ncbi:unnamed protein product [Schistocephalus solidus]|uniref:Reverse transcriptase domain-containing protein n=1 Tax=Schistocephalus solidus TaxID=70667 RepID=A0A183TN42_SCHSO|nr:unnamed protein product [Schistocephalus solidus]
MAGGVLPWVSMEAHVAEKIHASAYAGHNSRVYGYIHELLFADDCILNTVTEEDMQRSMDLFAADHANFGLTISTAKTVVMHQPPPSAE